MADALRPITLLLGAFCLWALCLLALSFAGLGSRFSAPAQGAAAPALPQISLVRTQSRLGGLANYQEVGQRPLFNADRRPGPQPDAAGEGSSDLDVVLTSVMITPKLQMAIFTDNKDASSRRVRLGEVVPGSNWRLVLLEPRRAVLEGPSGQRDLGLRVFDGKGGQSPTTIVAATSASMPERGSDSNDSATPEAAASTQAAPPPAPQVVAQQSNDSNPEQGASTAQTQEQQVEAIRRRIEARRAQMRAEAASAAAREK